ncbi:MAG TPA: hypothetical protein PLU47_00885 [Azonexus sp.]|nr:hypothetical protein [Azonexus sp.]
MNEVESLREEIAGLRVEVEALRAETDRVDDWVLGLFCALEDVLRPLLRSNPELANSIAPDWQEAAARFDLLTNNPAEGQADCFHETPDKLEARQLLYRRLALLKLWTAPV